VIVIIFEMQKE